MSSLPGLVIIGAGQAGTQAALSARAGGYRNPITLISDESHLPYQRPPLSKSYLLGTCAEDGLLIHRPSVYQAKDIDLITHTRVVAINRDDHTLNLSNGQTLPYASLVIATGARSRRLEIPGETLDGVHYLRGLDDAQALKDRLTNAKTAVVIGGGFIGLEFAAVARSLGLDVTVLEAGDTLLSRTASPFLSDYFRALHERHGVTICLGARVTKITGERQTVQAVHDLSLGRQPADIVVIGIGATPNSDLAHASGLCDTGAIPVDPFLQTTDARIFAIGDCTAYPCRGRYYRMESVQNATDQGRHVARTVCGDRRPYSAVPWFWSDQYDVKLQIAGWIQDADERIVRGNIDTHHFSVFSFAKGELIGVESVNAPVDHALARKVLGGQSPITAAEFKDTEADFRTIVNQKVREAAPAT